MNKLVLSLLLVFTYLHGTSCHDASVTETSAVDNFDGTFTYTLNICSGSFEDTWGWEFDLNFASGTGNLISYTASITSTNTGNTINASVPSTSGTGEIEYGDFDGTGGTVWDDGASNFCATISLTVDTWVSSIDWQGPQFATFACSGTTNTTTGCFTNSVPDYTVDLTTPNCIGGNVTWNVVDPNGLVLNSGSQAQNGSTTSVSVCGCGNTLNMTVPAGNSGNPAQRCDDDMATSPGGPGQIEVFDGTGTSLGTATATGTAMTLDCAVLDVDILNFSAALNGNTSLVEWTSISETNAAYYILKRSTDGVNFEEIAKINAQGNSNEISNYSFSDDNLPSDVNYVYYKLYEENSSGDVFPLKSTALNLSLNAITQIFSIEGMNSSDQLNVFSNERTIVELHCYSADGKILMSKSVMLEIGYNSVDLPALNANKSGIMIINLENAKHREVEKFINL